MIDLVLWFRHKKLQYPLLQCFARIIGDIAIIFSIGSCYLFTRWQQVYMLSAEPALNDTAYSLLSRWQNKSDDTPTVMAHPQ